MEVAALVCGMPSSAGDVELRFHTAALVNLNPRQNYVRLAFEVRGSMYSGSVRLAGFTISPGRCGYEFSSVGPVMAAPP